MQLLYNIVIRLYFIAIFIASFFNKKARLWIKGRKNLFKDLRNNIGDAKNIIWVHCASLGEFEQGRPLIEVIKEKYPKYKILLTFYSPSGYEVRKNYKYADFVSYLPLDTPLNAKKFLSIVKPEKVFFVKYEFWFYFLKNIHDTKIPVYLISAMFRKNQLFFKGYGRWYRQSLFFFRHIFVQNDSSRYLLSKVNYDHVTVAGDTRFDRVHEIASNVTKNSMVELFKMNHPVLIAGSTWPEDDDLLVQFINECVNSWKFIVAPHVIDHSHIEHLQMRITKKSILFSESKDAHLADYDVMIIDNIGMLSSLYQYGNIAYIGGGFGKGIHNILEATTFGMPVVFGPNYQKFNEAKELIDAGGAFSISDFGGLKRFVHFFMTNPDSMKEAAVICSNYVKNNVGATQKILKETFE